MSTMVPSFIASANSFTGPPALKNFPEPVRTTALHDESSINSSNLFLIGSKFARLKVFLDASGDIDTTATPPSCLSTVKGMCPRRGHSLLNSMKVISQASLGSL